MMRSIFGLCIFVRVKGMLRCLHLAPFSGGKSYLVNTLFEVLDRFLKNVKKVPIFSKKKKPLSNF